MAVVFIKDDFEESIDKESIVANSQIQETMATGSNSNKEEKLTEAEIQLQNFFPQILEDVKKLKAIEPGNQTLPLARIKKIMKLDEDVKMISGEAPLLFAKATEIFIHELTLRAWVYTENNKRRTLQRNDIAMAISKYDQFDFLIDIVPREELKPKKEEKPVQQDYVYLLNQQQAQQPVVQTISTIPTLTQSPPTQTIQLQAAQSNGTGLQATSPQQIMITQSAQNQQLQQVQQGIGIPTTGIQIVQQVMSPNGEISQIPISLTTQQMNLLRAQMTQQPIILQTPQIFQMQTGQTGIPINMQSGLFLNSSGQLIQQQQQQNQIKDE